MTAELSSEMYWLVLTVLMTALFWLPYILNRMFEQGIGRAIWDPYGDTDTNVAWARRMMQAHQNAVENLVVFGPLVLAIELTGHHSAITALACMIYFFARLVHYLVFTFAIPVLRVLSFLVGFAMQMTLALQLLTS